MKRLPAPLPRTLTAVALAVPLALVGANATAADEKNPDVIACEGKNEGDPCESTKLVKEGESAERKVVRGVCRPDECCELDYSSGSPPKTNCGPCLACKGGPPEPTPDGEEAQLGGDAEGEPPRVEAGQDPPAQAPKEKGGCSLGSEAPPTWTAALLLLLGLRRERARIKGR